MGYAFDLIENETINRVVVAFELFRHRSEVAKRISIDKRRRLCLASLAFAPEEHPGKH